ncbi:hypothetical protein COE95_13130 [Bacillus toyonensis]|nr:hypothetical protein CN583_17455 [Bacillus toyonensis]PHC31190.1 hypothetical protein COE95_13130 [Bacillus toyonensis]
MVHILVERELKFLWHRILLFSQIQMKIKKKRSKQDANRQMVDTPNTQLQFVNLSNVHKTFDSEQ